jgi:protein-S-isoprenylcysteine O-methyltransferase Ste14
MEADIARGRKAMTRIKLGWIITTAEFALLGLLLAWQAWRIGPSLGHSPYNLALLLADATPLGVLLFRRPAAEMTRDPADWLSAFAATAAPMLLAPGGEAVVPAALGGAAMTLGLVVNLYAKAWLWRSFGLLPANRGVRMTGPYAVVRHPMYLSYAITQAGFLALNASTANACLVAAGMALQLIRLRAEERILVQDPSYRAYMALVPYRLAPGLF